MFISPSRIETAAFITWDSGFKNRASRPWSPQQQPLIRPYCFVADFRFCVHFRLKKMLTLTVLLTACQGCVIQICIEMFRVS